MHSLPLFSRNAVHILNSFVPDTGALPRGGNPPTDELDTEIEKIAKAYNDECKQDEDSFKTRYGRELRKTIAKLAGIEFKEAGSTNEAKLDTIKEEGGVWYESLRTASAMVIFVLLRSFLKLEYKDKTYDHDPDCRCSDYQPEKFLMGLSWDALTVCCLATDHVAMMCLKLRAWRDRMVNSSRYKIVLLIEAAIPEELLLKKRPQERPAGQPCDSTGLPWRLGLNAMFNEELKKHLRKGD